MTSLETKVKTGAALMARGPSPSQLGAMAAELAARAGGPTQAEAANELNVGLRTVGAAAIVMNADKALFAAVKAGTVPAKTAEEAVKQLPAPVRAAALESSDPAEALRVALATVKEPDPEVEAVAVHRLVRKLTEMATRKRKPTLSEIQQAVDEMAAEVAAAK